MFNFNFWPKNEALSRWFFSLLCILKQSRRAPTTLFLVEIMSRTRVSSFSLSALGEQGKSVSTPFSDFLYDDDRLFCSPWGIMTNGAEKIDRKIYSSRGKHAHFDWITYDLNRKIVDTHVSILPIIIRSPPVNFINWAIFKGLKGNPIFNKKISPMPQPERLLLRDYWSEFRIYRTWWQMLGIWNSIEAKNLDLHWWSINKRYIAHKIRWANNH